MPASCCFAMRASAAKVAEAMGVTARTVEHLKRRFVEEGLDPTLTRKTPAKPRDVDFDGAFDARITQLAC